MPYKIYVEMADIERAKTRPREELGSSCPILHVLEGWGWDETQILRAIDRTTDPTTPNQYYINIIVGDKDYVHKCDKYLNRWLDKWYCTSKKQVDPIRIGFGLAVGYDEDSLRGLTASAYSHEL